MAPRRFWTILSRHSGGIVENEMRGPRPKPADILLLTRLCGADSSAQVTSQLGVQVIVTKDLVWLSKELQIPLRFVSEIRIIDQKAMIPRYAISISFENPQLRKLEVVYLCSINFLGIYSREPLAKLLSILEPLVAEAKAAPLPLTPASQLATSQPTAPTADGCEICGATPTTYLPYWYAISVVVISYRSAEDRRRLCAKHNLAIGLQNYLPTALFGWIGIGVFLYPLILFRSAQQLRPSLGRAIYVLGIVPSLLVAAFLTYVWTRP